MKSKNQSPNLIHQPAARLTALLLLLLGLSACGNKGELYLPEEEPQQQESVTADHGV